jgi:predicted dehydrogenase
VIGSGYWGPNLIRNFVENQDTKVIGVADLAPARLAAIRDRFPQIGTLTTDYTDLFDLGLEAVVVSTPPETHSSIVADCLEHGLNVLVEKPLTTDVGSAIRLKELADSRDLVLMVGHTFEFNPAVRALKAMVDEGIAGDVRYIDAVRVGLGLFHPRLNVVWDLAPHDISILIHVLEEMPTTVSTRGIACVQPDVEDVAYLTLMFPSGILAHIRLSWLDPMKTRRLTVVGSRKMIVYDDVRSTRRSVCMTSASTPCRTPTRSVRSSSPITTAVSRSRRSTSKSRSASNASISCSASVTVCVHSPMPTTASVWCV